MRLLLDSHAFIWYVVDDSNLSRDFPLVTLTSMIASSPDWLVGVDSLSLIENDEWLLTKIAILYGYDAGTDSGPTYTFPDQIKCHTALTLASRISPRWSMAKSSLSAHSPSRAWINDC